AHLPEPRLGAGRGDQRRARALRRRADGGALPLCQAKAADLMPTYRPGPVSLIAATLVALFLLMPLLAVVPVSFTPSRMLAMPSGELSLRHYRALIEDPKWIGGILLSIRIGIV